MRFYFEEGTIRFPVIIHLPLSSLTTHPRLCLPTAVTIATASPAAPDRDHWRNVSVQTAVFMWIKPELLESYVRLELKFLRRETWSGVGVVLLNNSLGNGVRHLAHVLVIDAKDCVSKAGGLTPITPIPPHMYCSAAHAKCWKTSLVEYSLRPWMIYSQTNIMNS